MDSGGTASSPTRGGPARLPARRGPSPSSPAEADGVTLPLLCFMTSAFKNSSHSSGFSSAGLAVVKPLKQRLVLKGKGWVPTHLSFAHEVFCICLRQREVFPPAAENLALRNISSDTRMKQCPCITADSWDTRRKNHRITDWFELEGTLQTI